jgi:hypothetical protein
VRAGSQGGATVRIVGITKVLLAGKKQNTSHNRLDIFHFAFLLDASKSIDGLLVHGDGAYIVRSARQLCQIVLKQKTERIQEATGRLFRQIQKLAILRNLWGHIIWVGSPEKKLVLDIATTINGEHPPKCG